MNAKSTGLVPKPCSSPKIDPADMEDVKQESSMDEPLEDSSMVKDSDSTTESRQSNSADFDRSILDGRISDDEEEMIKDQNLLSTHSNGLNSLASLQNYVGTSSDSDS